MNTKTLNQKIIRSVIISHKFDISVKFAFKRHQTWVVWEE